MRIIAITTPSCTKCKTEIPLVKEICDTRGIDLEILNAFDEGSNYVEEYDITSVPFFLLEVEGEVVKTFSGDDSSIYIQMYLEKSL